MAKPEKIDPSDAVVVSSFIAAFIGDVLFFLLIPHYICGVIMLAGFWHKSKGLLAKAVLIIVFILPLPLLTVGIFISLILSNKVLAFLAEQVVILGVGAATAGTGAVVGEAVEGAAIAGEAAAAAAEAGEATAAATTAVEAGGATGITAEAGEVGANAAAGGTEATAEAGAGGGGETASGNLPDKMASREEGNPMENLQEELTEPQERISEGQEEEFQDDSQNRKPTKATEKVKKAFDIINRANIQREQNSNRPEEQGGEDGEDA